MKLFATALLALSLNAVAAVDLAKSEVKWTGAKVTGKHNGTAPLKSANLVQDDKGNLTGGDFVIDLANLAVTDLQGEYKGKLEGHLKAADFFDTAKYPTAAFKITKVTGSKVSGDLTIKGITKPTTFEMKKTGKNYEGQATFDRTLYGVKYNSKSFFDVKALGDKAIDDKVIVDFKIVQN